MKYKKIKLLAPGILLLFATLVLNAQKDSQLSLTESGRYVLGCNYWASHAGTDMWRNWQPTVIDADLKQLSEAGMHVIRVFPVWPDFQPIVQFYTAEGILKEIRFKDGPLPGIGPGKNGVSVEMLARFREFADMAKKHNIKLIVGLVTGWMSGKLFIPQALEGRKILSDPVSIMWQVKFVRTMVQELNDHPAIIAWDLGNECNVMEKVEKPEVAYVWTASLTNAIKAEDNSRPIVSGMHSLSPDNNAKWRIQDQGELCDLLTTHPYPFWTPHTNQDPATTIRTIMHSAAETRLYGDIGGKPCLVEEIGIMGPMEANESSKAAFLRSILFNNWANHCQGLLWWCAYDQNQLNFPPYEWTSVERDLGLFRTDRTAKPIVNEIYKFRKFLDSLPFDALPKQKKEAVCILTEGQDQWGVAYSGFILAKQAGFDIEFQYGNQPIKKSDLYILPSIKGTDLLNRTEWLQILENVKKGATLYVSYDWGFLSHFLDPAGFEVVTSQNRNVPVDFISTDKTIKPFSMKSGRKLTISATRARILAREKDGNPLFTESSYGKGKIFFLAMPLEMNLTNTPGGFTDNPSEAWKIYQIIAADVISQNRIVTKNDPFTGSTEHDLSAHEKVIVLVNYAPSDKLITFDMHKDWKVDQTLYGHTPVKSKVKLGANDACVLIISRK
jgi:hypothetical protein